MGLSLNIRYDLKNISLSCPTVVAPVIQTLRLLNLRVNLLP